MDVDGLWDGHDVVVLRGGVAVNSNDEIKAPYQKAAVVARHRGRCAWVIAGTTARMSRRNPTDWNPWA
ncbi:MAG: hypothetical protein D8M59_16865 [Planctomycetes bacterium]|nr:hypothetical protein [Planctomycetota bacterium]